MTPAEFEFICNTVRQRSGLVLTADKTYLVESRLMPMARRQGHEALSDYIGAIRRNPTAEALDAVTEAMTTNESFFFRDKTPFENFTNVMMPALRQARGPGAPLRVWCAAASTGQEPYSLAMMLSEDSALAGGRKVEILGTDISNRVLQKAREGIYSQFEVQRGLPVKFLVKYFTKVEDAWQIVQDLRRQVEYRSFNLLDDFRPLGRFDIVFCRNVLIYFDPPTKKRVLERIADVMTPDGFLVVGAAETVFGITDVFKPLKGSRGLYVRTENAVEVTAAAAARG